MIKSLHFLVPERIKIGRLSKKRKKHNLSTKQGKGGPPPDLAYTRKSG